MRVRILACLAVALLMLAALPTASVARSELLIPPTPQAWIRAEQFAGTVRAGTLGLIVSGGTWTNGELRNGAYDGNKVTSRDTIDLTGGAEIYLSFRPDGAGQYMVLHPRLFTGVAVKPMTTRRSRAGSIVVPDRAWLYGHLRVAPDGTYQLMIARNAYDDAGGDVIYSDTGRLAAMLGRLELQFGNNRAGTKANVVIGEARVR